MEKMCGKIKGPLPSNEMSVTEQEISMTEEESIIILTFRMTSYTLLNVNDHVNNNFHHCIAML